MYTTLFFCLMQKLFLCFLEHNVFAELGAVFLELNLALDFSLVLARKIDLSGRLVANLYELIL